MQDLVAKLDAALPELWEPHPRPTVAPLSRISAHFNLSLPHELIELARSSDRFSDLFLSFGENYTEPNHVIAYNRYWKRRRRTRKLPGDLVILTNGFMDEDFWCLVRPGDHNEPERPVVEYWSPAPIGFPKDGIRGPAHSTFSSFLSMLVAHHAGRGGDA